MRIGILEPAAAKLRDGEIRQSEFSRIKTGVLAGEDEPGSRRSRCEGVGNGCKLDRFGAGADRERNRCGQSSP